MIFELKSTQACEGLDLLTNSILNDQELVLAFCFLN
jgi:hypothetical protein